MSKNKQNNQNNSILGRFYTFQFKSLPWVKTNNLSKVLGNNSKKDSGFVIIAIIIGAIFGLIFFLSIFSFLAQNNSGDGTGIKKGTNETNNKPDSQAPTNNKPDTQAPTNNKPQKEDISQDLGSGYLVCVELNGVNPPRTPALDRRVARFWIETKQDLDAHGIPAMRFSWGFRTNCQQINVDSGGNSKATPGTSPHEAGRALDARDMTRRKDADLIVSIFNRHGWRWLGPIKDPPHFDIQGYQVGERSHADWIRKAQADYERGGPRESCRGPRCGS